MRNQRRKRKKEAKRRKKMKKETGKEGLEAEERLDLTPVERPKVIKYIYIVGKRRSVASQRVAESNKTNWALITPIRSS
jgi:hypothetical protein